jgi:hypothetical protein
MPEIIRVETSRRSADTNSAMRTCLLTLLLLLAFQGCVRAADTGAHSPLILPDLHGGEKRPLAVKGHGTVLFFITHDCPISNTYSPEIRRLQAEFESQGFSFSIVYVDPDAKTATLRKHQQEFGLESLTAFHDRHHRLVTTTGAKVTPEAVVIDKQGVIAYRGRINNLYADFGKRRRRATVTELRDALQAMLKGTPIKTPRSDAIGCYIPKVRNLKADEKQP